MKKLLLFLLVMFTMLNCVQKPQRDIKRYVTTTVQADGSEELVYWYVLYVDGGMSSYYSSPVPVNNISTIPWIASNELPTELTADFPEAQVDINNIEVNDPEFVSETNSESSDTDSGSDGGSDGGGCGDGGGGE